jgi:LmbE family N-acetylglucosaminyl deacetylase
MLRRTFLLLLLLIGAAAAFQPAADQRKPGKFLIVVAHPDDEYYVAATVYRIAIQLNGIVDELVITNGEGGFRYSTTAEAYYGKQLTQEDVGRRELPAIRKQETLNAGKILGIRTHCFLDQKDETFTTDIEAGLNHLWDSAFVTSMIASLIRGEHYQYVLTILPRSTTHGHHQAATVLARRAILSLAAAERPVILAADTDESAYSAVPSQPDTHIWGAAPDFEFDRNTHFGFQNALSYQIPVNWAIAEHKSQGLFQTSYGKDAKEYFWVDRADTPNADDLARRLFQLVLAAKPAVK